MSATSKLRLDYLEVNQSQKEVTVNEAFNKLDFFVGLTVESVTSSPPGSASEGTAFLVGTSAAGAWLGKEGNIAHYLNGAYEFYVPFAGLRLYVAATGLEYRYVQGVWEQITVPNIQVVDALPTSPLEGTIYLVKEAGA